MLALGMNHIIVNGTKTKLEGNIIAFDEVLKLATQLRTATVTYSKASGGHSGTMLPGDVVQIQDGTVFNVAVTSGA